ncbi:hypothetical protein [Absidia glauca]|uniref:Uncharacterized protein n=1 Tax=Absidia glauca TaxID=4829 RepID=A0A163MM39_ABSGL|nr:hypothetical protein [Absidia glauca]
MSMGYDTACSSFVDNLIMTATPECQIAYGDGEALESSSSSSSSSATMTPSFDNIVSSAALDRTMDNMDNKNTSYALDHWKY